MEFVKGGFKPEEEIALTLLTDLVTFRTKTDLSSALKLHLIDGLSSHRAAAETGAKPSSLRLALEYLGARMIDYKALYESPFWSESAVKSGGFKDEVFLEKFCQLLKAGTAETTLQALRAYLLEGKTQTVAADLVGIPQSRVGKRIKTLKNFYNGIDKLGAEMVKLGHWTVSK